MLNHQVQHPSLDALPVDAGLAVDMTPNVPPDGAIAGLHAILRPSATIHQSTSRCVRPPPDAPHGHPRNCCSSGAGWWVYSPTTPVAQLSPDPMSSVDAVSPGDVLGRGVGTGAVPM